MLIPDTRDLHSYAWTPQPQAGRLITQLVEQYLEGHAYAAQLAVRMRDETGTRFVDWIDSIFLPHLPPGAADAGFVETSPGVWHHPGGLFPNLVLGRMPCTEVLLRVESVVDFLAAHPPLRDTVIDGDALAPVRLAWSSPGAVERHGHRGYVSVAWDDRQTERVQRHAKALRQRRREFDDEHDGFAHLKSLLDSAISDLGVDRACDVFFAAERDYWQSRNQAAQVQKARQDKLGLGWANHDHHTYRSSRRHFVQLVAVFESLGLRCRERFYAGHEAGWGAQVMEQPRAGIVVFADVDLLPEEVMGDFAHESLPPSPSLGTVGLWCGLHGESMLQAGMHHLECQFDFDSLKRQLQHDAGIGVMKPFTDLPYLRQAFTEGERWPVSERRVARLVAQGLITPGQAAAFTRDGALGSHLENLERHDGFKGFNQKGVSDIIAATDPRLHVGA